MPLLGYFGIVGSILVGLLYVASAQLGPPSRLSVTTDFHGLPAPYKAQSSPILTVREAPAPDMPATTVAQPAVTPDPRPAATADPQPVKTVKVVKKAKKSTKTARHNAGRNLFAETGTSPARTHRLW